MKFLHAADIDLDSPLTGLRARAAFTAMINLAMDEGLAFVVVAAICTTASGRVSRCRAARALVL